MRVSKSLFVFAVSATLITSVSKADQTLADLNLNFTTAASSEALMKLPVSPAKDAVSYREALVNAKSGDDKNNSITKSAFISICGAERSANGHRKCVSVYKPTFSNATIRYTTGAADKDKREWGALDLVDQMNEASTDHSLNFKSAILSAVKSGIGLSQAILVIVPVRLSGIVVTTKSSFWNPERDKLHFQYKLVPSAAKTYPIGNLIVNKDLVIDGETSFRLQYIAANEKFKMFNPPIGALQSRILSQLMPATSITLRNVLNLTVAYNLTRQNPGWKSIRDLLANEKTDGAMRDFTANAEVKALIADPLFQAVQKLDLKSIGAQYLMQTAELKVQIAEYVETNSIEAGTITKVEPAAAQAVGNLASYSNVSAPGLSYQEKLARYEYYSRVTDDTLSGLAAASEGATSLANLILR